MKSFTRILLVSTMVACTIVAANAQLEITQSSIQPKETPITLRLQRGMVEVAFDVEVTSKLVDTNECCLITPVFENGDYLYELPSIAIEGRNYSIIARERERFDNLHIPSSNIMKRLRYKTGLENKVHYEHVTPYTAEMRSSIFYLRTTIHKVCGGVIKKRTTKQELAHGIMDYSSYVLIDPVVYYYPNSVDKVFEDNFGAKSMFRQGVSTVDRKVFEANGYNEFKNTVSFMQKDNSIDIKKVHIITAASPEGSLANNHRLAEQRADAVANLLMTDLNIPADLITKEALDENWNLFIQELPATSLSNQDAIMNIILNTSDLDARENQMKQLGNWGSIYNVFQNLRNCLVSIEYTLTDPYKDKIEIFGKDMVKIYLIEGKGITPLEKARKLYDENPQSVENLNNLMVALMERGNYNEASIYADQISNSGIDPVVANNKAVLCMLLNDPRTAQSLFKLAEDVPMATYNEGLMLLKDEQYEAAVEKFSAYESVNKTVANLYSNKNKEAAGTTHTMIESGQGYYLCAIAYAKDGQTALAMKALRKAIDMESLWKVEALNQAEFIQYRSNDEFKEITQ